jgi:hypothetical protein
MPRTRPPYPPEHCAACWESPVGGENPILRTGQLVSKGSWGPKWDPKLRETGETSGAPDRSTDHPTPIFIAT